MVLRSKRKTAWRRIIRNDVFDRRVRIYDGHVSGCSQRRNLYFKRQSEYKDAPIGSDAIELLGLHDVTFEYEITSNRVDCFGVLGIAREVAATFGKNLFLRL